LGVIDDLMIGSRFYHHKDTLGRPQLDLCMRRVVPEAAAFVIGWSLDGTGGNWMLVFLLLAASRVLSAGVMAAVKA
jgi:hypothetical protein